MTELIEALKELTPSQWKFLAVAIPAMYAIFWLMALIGG